MSSHADHPRLVALRAKIEAEGVEALRVEECVEADRLEAGRVEAVSF